MRCGVVATTIVIGRWISPTGTGVPQGQVDLTPVTQTGIGGWIPLAEKVVAVLDANGTISQQMASLRGVPQLQVSEQLIGAPVTSYTVTPPTARTDAVTNTSGSSTITDAAIASTDAGKAVAGVGVPIPAYVGAVVAGVSFTLVDASSNALPTTATVSSIVVGAVDLTTIARGV